MRDDPPTKTISSTLAFEIFASLITRSTGSIVFLNNAILISSNLAREIEALKSIPSYNASISIYAWVAFDRVRFARSHDVLRRRSARAFPAKSLPRFFFLNSFIKCFTMLLSKSSPPKCVSPAVAATSNIPSSIDNSDTSNVPPPRSKIRIFFSSDDSFSKPYAIAAAVGSLIMRKILSPAILPASIVEARCASLKYAGTVTTAFFTSPPK